MAGPKSDYWKKGFLAAFTKDRICTKKYMHVPLGIFQPYIRQTFNCTLYNKTADVLFKNEI